MSSAICLNLYQTKILSSGNGLILYNKTQIFFNDVDKDSFWKTSEKILITNIFFFSHIVFCPITDKPKHLSRIEYRRLLMLSIWTSLKFCHLVKTEILKALFGNCFSGLFCYLQKVVLPFYLFK